MTRARHSARSIAPYIRAGRRESRNGGHGEAYILAWFLIKVGSGLDVVHLIEPVFVLDSERERSTVFFWFKVDSKGGRKSPLTVRYRVRKEVGGQGRESTWNAKQQVRRTSFEVEIPQVRRTFETHLVQLGALPNLVNGVCIS